jgi:hypothetical protein
VSILAKQKFRIPLKVKLSLLITLLIALSVLLVGDSLLERGACATVQDRPRPSAIAEWRSVLQYDPNHEGAKRNIATAERLLQGLQERQQKQGR